MMSKPSLLQEGKMEELEPATRRVRTCRSVISMHSVSVQVNDQAMRAPPPRPPKKLDVPLQDVAELPYTYNIATLHSGYRVCALLMRKLMSMGRFSKNDVSMTCRTKLDEVQQAAVSLMQGAQSNGCARCDCVDADVHKRVLKAMETYNQAVQHACGETDKAFESFVKVRVDAAHTVWLAHC